MKMQDEPKQEFPGFIVFMNIVNTITHMVLGAIAMCAFVFAIVLPANNATHLVQHIYLCVIGYVLLMAQAVLSFSPYNGWSMSLKHEDKKIAHWIIQVLGSILAIAGSIVRIANLDELFQSAHGILGFIAMIFTIISLLGGVCNLYLKTTLFTKIIHSCIGSLTLLFAFLALCLGFDRPVYRFFLGDNVANLGIGLTAVGLVGVIVSACISNIKRLTNR